MTYPKNDIIKWCVYGTKAYNCNKYQENIHQKLHGHNLRGQTFTERMCTVTEENSRYKHLLNMAIAVQCYPTVLCCYLNVKLHVIDS